MSETKAWVEYPDHWKMQPTGTTHRNFRFIDF